MKITLKEFTERKKVVKLLESYACCYLDSPEGERILASKSFSNKVSESFKLLSSIDAKDIPLELISEEDFGDVVMYLSHITAKIK